MTTTHDLSWLLARVVKDEATGCWNWILKPNVEGYCQTQYDGKYPMAHRAMYVALGGVIPDGLQLDHLCRNRRCCNPDHLEPVTGRENKARGLTLNAANTAKTHCPRGHELAGENLRIDARGSRRCRTCSRLQDKAKKRSDAALAQKSGAFACECGARFANKRALGVHRTRRHGRGWVPDELDARCQWLAAS